MDEYFPGDCVPLMFEEDVIFCTILNYIGCGNFHVELTRGLVPSKLNRFVGINTLHESVIDEFRVDLDE